MLYRNLKSKLKLHAKKKERQISNLKHKKLRSRLHHCRFNPKRFAVSDSWRNGKTGRRLFQVSQLFLRSILSKMGKWLNV